MEQLAIDFAATPVADDPAPFSVAAAQLDALRLLEQRGPMSGEDLSDALMEMGHRPHDLRAFGKVYQGLSRRREIAVHGYCPRRRGNGTAGGLIWRRVAR